MTARDIFSDRQLAGQRLMVGFDGTTLDSNLKFLIDTLKVGGIILFARNLESPDQIQRLCDAVQAYARTCGQPPLFIAIDQEGGQVARLKPPFTQFPGNPAMSGIGEAAHFARVTARELSAVGINMNMAPVLDVAAPGMGGIMKGRAFGDDPLWVSAMGAEVISGLQERHIMAVAKHFPGIGRTTLDSHLERPVLDCSDREMKKDLMPFQTAITSKVAGMMLSHIVYPHMDPHWPASLSVKIARDLLRTKMGFGGLVLTDDLDMGAIVRHYDEAAVIGQILAATIDIVLICHAGPKIEAAFEHILRAITGADDLRRAGAASVRRIMALKQAYLEPAGGV